jgi:serine/threonine-protein kinase
VETTSTAAPRLLGERYRVGRLMGRGGMADVFEGVDERLGRPVAVKILRRPLLRNPDVRARFEQEARSAARLSHPNVVAVFDTGEDEGVPYLVMELLPGETLADHMADGPQDPDWMVRVAGDVLGALAAAHAAGVVHRDVKPGNILLGTDGCAKVADFGIAKSAEAAAGPDTTATGMLLGTPAYLAPERIDGQPATPRSDLYSLGVVLYEALAGRKPFEADTPLGVANAIRHADPVPLSSVRPDIEPSVAAAVERAMARDPVARFADAAEMADALGAGRVSVAAGDVTSAMAIGDATTVVPVAPLPAAGRVAGPRRRPMASPVTLLTAAAVVVFVLLLAAAANRGDTDGVDRGSLAGRIRDLAERVKVGDGPKGPELSARLARVAGDVEAGGGSDAGNRLLADVAAWHQQRLLFDRAATETTALLREIPGVAPPTVATVPPTTVPPTTVAPVVQPAGPADDGGGDKKKGNGKRKGDD